MAGWQVSVVHQDGTLSIGTDSTGTAGKLPRYPQHIRAKVYAPVLCCPSSNVIWYQMFTIINNNYFYRCVISEITYHDALNDRIGLQLVPNCYLLTIIIVRGTLAADCSLDLPLSVRLLSVHHGATRQSLTLGREVNLQSISYHCITSFVH